MGEEEQIMEGVLVPQTLTDLLESAKHLPLNPLAQAEAICKHLVENSPFACPAGNMIAVTACFWAHICEKEGAEYKRRMERMVWLQPTLTKPAEVRQNTGGRPGFTYIQAFAPTGLPASAQVLVAVVANRQCTGHLDVITMFSPRRPRDIEKLRKEQLAWA